MAKIIFNKNQKNSEGIVGGYLNETQLAFKMPSANLVHYTVLDCSDSDYNDFYTGKKHIVVNSDDSISAGDLETATTVTTEAEFTADIENILWELTEFKKKFPSHSKISEVDASITFCEGIDYSSLTYPGKTAKRYLIDNNKYINTRLI